MFEERCANPSRMTFPVNGYMVGTQFDDDQILSALRRCFVLDGMAPREVGGSVALLTAAENLLNGT